MQQIIEFGPKFCQAQIYEVLQKELAHPDHGMDERISAYDMSFQESISEVWFDLSLTEWVATEEIVFLFSWIRNIKSLKSIKVVLPARYTFSFLVESGNISRTQYANYKKRVIGNGTEFDDDENALNRRKRSSSFLMAVYGLLDRIGLSESDFLNMADYDIYNKEVSRLRENNHQIIPFTFFDLNSVGQVAKYDEHFNDVINNNFTSKHKTGKIFDLENELSVLLERYACYSPFESRILSNVVTQELYINSLQHSFSGELKYPVLEECYIAAFLANEWKSTNNDKFNPSFLEEKLPEALDFYKDKKKIKVEIDEVLARPNNRKAKSRPADLSKVVDKFNNISYLEYSFVDLGVGIHQSLKSHFDALSDSEIRDLPFSNGFQGAHLHSKILEYAFLMDSSRFPLEKVIENYQLVPRGLYFLVDMVRRYKGLLTIKSGFGQVVYDFSDKIYIDNNHDKAKSKLIPIFSVADAVIHQDADKATFFPGTMISIVLPERTISLEEKLKELKNRKNKDLTVLSPVRQQSAVLSRYAYSITDQMFAAVEHPLEQFASTDHHYVSILFLYNEIIEEFKATGIEVNIKDTYNKLFSKINSLLNNYNKSNCIVFMDFSGLKSGNMTWIKLLYFLVNTPKVNEIAKVVIVNLPDEETKILPIIRENLSCESLLKSNHTKQSSHTFLFRPIPCISFRTDVQSDEQRVNWIGLKSVNDESLLTSLMLGRSKNNYYDQSLFVNPENVEGNMFVKDGDRISSTFIGFDALIKIFKAEQRKSITKFLKSQIEPAPTVLKEKKLVYLASNGGYQFRYLSLYEVLHDQYFARFFAKTLLDNYCSYIREQLLDYQGQGMPDFTFTKIVVVTVSSQLLGVAIRDLIVKDPTYSLLNSSAEGPLNPELIILSSYYSFDAEIPFENISSDDRVLIVNDVVSTGNLVKRLWEKIEGRKEAIVNAVFTIADTRITRPKRKRRKSDEKEMYTEVFKEGQEKLIFSLTNSKDRFIIRKYLGPYTGPLLQMRINPLLNTVVDISSVNGEHDKILFPDILTFFNETELRSDFLKIGHFKQNQVHNGYLTDMSKIFNAESGISVLEAIKAALDEKCGVQATVRDKIDLNTYGHILKKELEAKHDAQSSQIKRLLEEIDEKLQEIEGLNIDTTNRSNNFKVDYIFYPVFSSIEKIDPQALSERFGLHVDNIIGLQRFATPKGWRFPFPAKRLNLLTRNKSVLILDSGSLTGESLVQLIDNVCFLEVRNIVVITVITRVEDFYREFYSRTRAINVLRAEHIQVDFGTGKSDKIIPIEVLFGINLHIPVYSTTNTCPFCQESDSLQGLVDQHFEIMPERVKQYVISRLDQLRLQDSFRGGLENLSILPKHRDTGLVETQHIFQMRDLLGKIDSYRFYPDYFWQFNQLQIKISSDDNWYGDVELLKNVELIMICILHEPVLAELVKNYTNGIYSAIRQLLKKLFNEEFNTNLLFYLWEPYSIVRLTALLSKDILFDIGQFEKILKLEDGSVENFLMFKYWEILYTSNNKERERTDIYLLLKSFNDNYQQKSSTNKVYNKKNREFTKILFRRMPLRSLPTHKQLDSHFENLSHFVYKNENMGNHFELTYRLNQLFLSVESPVRSLQKIMVDFTRVMDYFNDNLRPSIVRISSNPMIKEYVPLIFEKFSHEHTGVLFYTNKLESIYKVLKDVKQEEIDNYESYFESISKIYDKLSDDIFRIDERSDCFYNICKQYPCNLKLTLEEFKLRYSVQKTAIVMPVFEWDQNDYEIAFNKIILEVILDEIIENAEKAFFKTNENLTIRLSLSKITREEIELDIVQNNAFEKPQTEGGRTKLIQYFVKELQGTFQDNSRESIRSGADYWMKLRFRKYSYIPPVEERFEDEVEFN